MYKALKPGGLFLLDVLRHCGMKGGRKVLHGKFAKMVVSGAQTRNLPEWEYLYNENVGMHRQIIIENDKIRCFNIWNTCFTKQSLLDEAEVHGFTESAFYADVTGGPFGENAVTLCAILKKQEENHCI